METKTFKSIEEIEDYYDKETNTYEFKENEELLNITLEFELLTNANIHVFNIDCDDIDCNNIEANNIDCGNITANNIRGWNIYADNITTRTIYARTINAKGICADNIKFYSVCIAQNYLQCTAITGTRPNHIYKCLDKEVVFEKKQHTKQELIDLIGYDFEIID